MSTEPDAPALDGGTDSYYCEAQRSAEVSAQRDEVREVTLDWARDLGWKRLPRESGPLSFHIVGLVLWGGVHAEVSTHSSDDTTLFSVVIRVRRLYSGLLNDVDWAAYSFANGVLSELAARGATVSAPKLAAPRQNRARLRAMEQFRHRSHRALLILLVPVLLAVWFGTENGFYTVAAFSWLLGVLFSNQVLHLRLIGMRAWMHIGAAVLIFVCAVIMTVVGALYSAGIVHVVP